MAGTHKRNTLAMRASPRCGAKKRMDATCRSPAVAGKSRCRMHGGARGSGEPKGNQNALKHGMYTRENLEVQRRVRDLLRESKAFIEEALAHVAI